MIPVGRLAPVNQFDQTLLDDLFANKLYPTGLEFDRCEGYPARVAGACIVLPGRYWQGHEAEISMALARFSWVLLFITSDEEALFGTVAHPNLKVWRQTPRPGREYPGERFFGVGFTPHTQMLPDEVPQKLLDVFLSCQNTHSRRRECFQALDGVHGRVEATKGFTEGMSPAEYVRCMSKSRVAPCPSGAVSVDSFRVYEALESHALPVVDAVSPVDGSVDGPGGYWDQVLPGAPFRAVEDWAAVDWAALVEGWPANANRSTAFWMRYKRSLALQLREDLHELGAL